MAAYPSYSSLFFMTKLYHLHVIICCELGTFYIYTLCPIEQKIMTKRKNRISWNLYSSHHLTKNEVPQVEVWDVSFFLIAINDLINCITFPLTRCLLANVFNVSIASSSEWAIRLLYNSPLIKSPHGLSDKKTVLIIFHKRSRLPPLTSRELPNQHSHVY